MNRAKQSYYFKNTVILKEKQNNKTKKKNKKEEKNIHSLALILIADTGSPNVTSVILLIPK
jgi:hypothetical protein